MKKIILIVVAILVSAVIIIQFIPSELPATTLDNPNDIHNEVLIESDVSALLRNACFDCHSNETVYPWYSYVAPVSWLVAHDVEEGREELNFSEWIPYSLNRKKHKLDEIAEEVEEGEMPMKIFLVTHAEGRLTDEERKLIVDWALNLRGSAAD